MNELAKFDEVRAAIAQYKAENANLVFDYEDSQGNKDARSHIYKLRQAKTKIADIHKVAKAEALGVCRMLDGEKKKLTTEVNEMIDVHYKPVKEIEERVVKAAAVKANAERLEQIRIEAERVAEHERREDELAEREATAKAKEDELIRKAERLKATKQAELDKQAALKETREQAERDKVIAAAKVEQDKKDAAIQAGWDKQAAIEAEQEKARLAEMARVAKILADQDEKKRLADIEAERVADVEHRAAIERDAADAIGTFGGQACDVTALMEAIKDNEIPHVTINY